MYVFSTLLAATAVSAALPSCKPQPGSVDWPAASQWKALNASVGGRLAAVAPPGAVCHPGQSVYNNASCAAVAAQWTSSSWHAGSPWSVDYNDDTCPPTASLPCSAAGYPAYAVLATQASDVQAAVRFAARTGVRLTVKGTGHDYPGRSSGAGALEIWTHRMTGIVFNQDNSVTIPAGTQMHELYTEAGKHGRTVVGGSDPDVGIGGLIMNGGHSPISSRYGLPADQILAMDVVTADGQRRTLNAQSADQDLFWAVRGGGGSTYAVLLSVTVKSYPQLGGSIYRGGYYMPASSQTFWDFATYFTSQLANLSDAGGMGYFTMVPNSGSGNTSTAASVAALFIFPEKSVNQTQALMHALDRGFHYNTTILNGSTVTPFTNFMNTWAQTPAESVGSDSRLGSWLLDRQALTGSNARLQTALRTAIPDAATAELLGHLVAGRGVKNAQIPTGSDAVLPAWRNAYVHAVVPVAWQAGNATAKAVATNYLRGVSEPALKSLAPASGAYVNEADPTNANWQSDYYGANYARLLSIKNKWDPQGVFWCKPCVGHELWQWLDGPAENPLEWGVGQGSGKLCRA